MQSTGICCRRKKKMEKTIIETSQSLDSAVDEAMELVAAGKSIECALDAVFCDRVLGVCLKAVSA